MAGQGINGPFPFQTREYFDNAGDPNAAKGSTLSFEELDKTLLSLSASIASASANAGGAFLEQNVTPTLEVGGYNPQSTLQIGTTFTQFVVGLLTPYQNPSLNALTIKDAGESNIILLRELGNGFDASYIGLTATADSNGAFPNSASITWTGNTTGTSGNETDLLLDSDPLSSSNTIYLENSYNFNRSTSGTIPFTVTSKFPDNTTDTTATVSATFYIKSILAGTSTKLDNNYPASQSFYNDIVADSNNATTLRSNSTWAPGGNTNTNPPSNWSYYIYDASYTDPTLFSSALPNQPITSGWVKLNDITVDNQYGVSVTLTVWRSLQPGAYNNGATLSFS